MLNISPVSEMQIANLIVNLQAHDTIVKEIAENKYSVIGHGVTSEVEVVGEELQITILKKPFFVSEKMILSGLQDALKA